jgi:hypothetical protein
MNTPANKTAIIPRVFLKHNASTSKGIDTNLGITDK